MLLTILLSYADGYGPGANRDHRSPVDLVLQFLALIIIGFHIRHLHKKGFLRGNELINDDKRIMIYVFAVVVPSIIFTVIITSVFNFYAGIVVKVSANYVSAVNFNIKFCLVSVSLFLFKWLTEKTFNFFYRAYYFFRGKE